MTTAAIPAKCCWSNPPGAFEDCAGNQRNNGYFGAAGDEGSGDDGHPAVPLVFNGAGGHNAGHRTARADQHGDEAFPREAEFAENAVHDKGNPRHVADFF